MKKSVWLLWGQERKDMIIYSLVLLEMSYLLQRCKCLFFPFFLNITRKQSLLLPWNSQMIQTSDLETHSLNLRSFSIFFLRAAEKGNFEAAVKLGIAYLYNEGCKYEHLCFEMTEGMF